MNFLNSAWESIRESFSNYFRVVDAATRKSSIENSAEMVSNEIKKAEENISDNDVKNKIKQELPGNE